MQHDDGNLDWDSTIEEDGKVFEQLPPGEYAFKVLDFEKEYDGKNRNIAVLSLQCDDGKGTSGRIVDRLYLIKGAEFRLSQLWRSVGVKQHGQAVRPPWNRIVGMKGRLKLKHEEYQKDGETRKSTKVDCYLDPKPATSTAPNNGHVAQTQPAMAGASTASADDGLM